MGPLELIKQLWSLGRKAEELFQLQQWTREALSGIEARQRALEDRLIRLEAEQGKLIIEARSAATAASTMVAGTILSETVTRLTRLEMRTERLLSPPEDSD